MCRAQGPSRPGTYLVEATASRDAYCSCTTQGQSYVRSSAPLTSGQPAPAEDRRELRISKRVSSGARAIAPLRLEPLPSYDVRVLRELAHRRLVLSLARRFGRLATLHGLDAGVVALSALLSGWLTETSVRGALLPLVAFVLIGLNLRGSYRPGASRRNSYRLASGALIGALLAALPGTLAPDLSVSREFIALFGLACIAGLIIERHAVDSVVRLAYRRGLGLRRAVVVSRAPEAVDLMDGLRIPQADLSDGGDDQIVVGYLTPEDTRDPASLGTVARLEDVLDGSDVSEVIVATSLRRPTLTRVADACFARGVRLFVIPPAAYQMNGWSELTRVGRWPAYHLHPARLELPALILKRATDLVLASIGLIVVAPLMLLIMAAIRIETRGPVFFRQRRVGLGGRHFMMWKFRSMKLHAESERQAIAHLNSYADERLFKTPNDPRITRVGRFLRRFSLDELPQLFNILVGDMSLVGPRPPLPSEVNSYEAHHLIRLSVVPGLTGPWQVNGRNLITDFEEVVRLERSYIESWSLRSDIEIMLRTLGVVLSGKGAY
jgi:exopolysaccharide biosynthesis polyprenyl glycosylphosphotransferase